MALRPLLPAPLLLSAVPAVESVVAGVHSDEPLAPLTAMGCAAYPPCSRSCGTGWALLPPPAPLRPPLPKPALAPCCCSGSGCCSWSAVGVVAPRGDCAAGAAGVSIASLWGRGGG